MKTLSQLETAVLLVLQMHRGAEKRITKPRLRARVSTSLDRYVESDELDCALDRLRRTMPGARVCVAYDGIYYARSNEELDKYLREQEAIAQLRVMALLEQRRAAGLGEVAQ